MGRSLIGLGLEKRGLEEEGALGSSMQRLGRVLFELVQ